MCCVSNAISPCVVDAGLRNMCDDVFTTSPTRSPPATTVASTPSFFSPLPSCGTPVPSTLSLCLDAGRRHGSTRVRRSGLASLVT
jgi:hypothetical protein